VTARTRATGAPEKKAALIPTASMDDLGLSETLVKVIDCIASDEASFSTCHVPNVDRGHSAN
jgi:hypothetical protein